MGRGGRLGRASSAWGRVDGIEAPTTQIAYQPRVNPGAVRPPAPRRVAKIVKRDGEAKLFRYTEAQAGLPAKFFVYEHTTASRYLARGTDLDSAGRPVTVVEGAVELASESAEPAAVASQGTTTTTLEWNAAENKPAVLVEAAGSSAQRTTSYEYLPGGSGALTRQTVTDGKDTETTTLSYYPARADGFIADLQKLVAPGDRAWTFEVDAAGNTTSRTDPTGAQTKTEYGPGGIIARERDAVGNWTTYADHDASGQPQTVTLPGDPGVPARVWRYRYDARGDVVKVVDPRGSASALGASDPFVTTLTFDAFGRLVGERIPRDSGQAVATGPAFAERIRRSDRDGNVTYIDDARRETTIDYSPTGMPLAVHRTASSGPGTTRDEVSRAVYDGAGRLIATAAPMAAWVNAGDVAAQVRDEQVGACEGSGAPGAHPFVTRYCLDHRGLALAQAEYSNLTADIARRVTSFAYDGRGNVIGQNDPNRNTTGSGLSQSALTVAAAIAKAGDPGARRLSFSYDLRDRRVGLVERPAETGVVDRTSTWVYSPAGDLIERTQARPGEPARTERMDYDAAGRLLARTTPEGDLTCWKRRADGLVTAVTSPRGTAGDRARCTTVGASYATYTTALTYDAVGQLTSRSIPFAPDQYGPGRTDVASWKVTYRRDVVGDPVSITDARGNALANAFYDSGELRTTTRPSYWSIDWGPGQPTPSAGSEYEAADSADIEVAVDGPQITEASGAPGSQRAGLASGPDGAANGDFGQPDRQALPSWLPEAGATELRYDEGMRLTGVVDADGAVRDIDYDPAGRVVRKRWPFDGAGPIVHDFEYDANGNLTRVAEDITADAEAVTTFAYDGYDRRTGETAPGASASGYSDPAQPEVTRLSYDANGNVWARTTPRGGAFAYAYDSLDQLVSEANPAGETWRYRYDSFGDLRETESPHRAGADAALYTTYSTYDRAARLAGQTRLVDQPAGGPRQLAWEFGYDADGNRARIVEPGAAGPQTTQIDYDGRGLPWRTTVSGGTGAGALSRTQITEYDANGAVRREVNPAGLDATTRLPRVADDGTEAGADAAAQDATVYERDPHGLVVRQRLPWRGGGDEHWVRTIKRESPQRRITQIYLPKLPSESDVWGEEYTYNAAGWITSRRDFYRSRPSADEIEQPYVRYSYDRQGQQTRWRSEHAKVSDAGRDIRWEYWPNGLIRRRTAVKTIDRAGGAEDTQTRQSYDYLYNLNRSLVRTVDHPQGYDRDEQGARITVFARDAAERQTRVISPGSDALFVYDEGATGLLTERRTGGNFDAQQRYVGDYTATFTYDSLGRELTTDYSGRVTRTTWSDGGQISERVKSNGTRDVWERDGLGRLARHRRVQASGAEDPVLSGGYRYDVNGNRVQDERGEFAYNARDQITWWKRWTDRGRTDRRGWTRDYALNGSGAIVGQVDRDTGGTVRSDSRMTYDGERLEEVRIAATLDPLLPAVNRTQTFRYDDAGNVQRIYTRTDVPLQQPIAKTSIPAAQCSSRDMVTTGEAGYAAESITRYCYDEFNRQIFASGPDLTMSMIAYDALDRRELERSYNALGVLDGTRSFSYIGTSELLALLQARTPTSTTTSTQNFFYDSAGDRLGVFIWDLMDMRYRSYAKDANGSVTGLEDPDGSIADRQRYDYDPYGELLAASDSGQAPSGDALLNPFRFEGFYYDANVGSYDMQARSYRPEYGRFLQRDQYASASADLGLVSDPLTQNRYAFAGGNPVTNIETDGHDPHAAETAARGCLSCPVGAKKQQQVNRVVSRVLDSQSAAAKPALRPLGMTQMAASVHLAPDSATRNGGGLGSTIAGGLGAGTRWLGNALEDVAEFSCDTFANSNPTCGAAYYTNYQPPTVGDAAEQLSMLLPSTRLGATVASRFPKLTSALGSLANSTRGILGRGAAKGADDATRLLGPGTSFGSKVEGQLAGRGWTRRLVQSTIDDPARTVATRDTRFLRGGGRMDDPATGYISRRGGYVIRNDRTGDIVQVSKRTDPNWRAPWDR